MQTKGLLLTLALSTSLAIADGLPPPSKTVFKCEDGKRTYCSDSPCLGTKKLDVTPTRGMPKSSNSTPSATKTVADDIAGIARALGDIARAKGMAQVAKEAGLSRESLYKALSENGNPSFATILKVTKALGVQLHAGVA